MSNIVCLSRKNMPVFTSENNASIRIKNPLIKIGATSLSKSDPMMPFDKIVLARTILGDDFIEPKEITKVKKSPYTKEQLENFKQAIPLEEVLYRLKTNDYMLIAGPHKRLSLSNIQPFSENIYFSADENFLNKAKVGPEWLAIRKVPVPGSIDKKLSQQIRLLTNSEHIPNIAKFVWCIKMYHAIRGKKLFEQIYVRVSSVDSFENFFVAGYFKKDEVVITYYADESCSDTLGLASEYQL